MPTSQRARLGRVSESWLGVRDEFRNWLIRDVMSMKRAHDFCASALPASADTGTRA
jgi:hypothetical protein